MPLVTAYSKIIKVMAKCVENSSSEESETSDSNDLSSADFSSSSESSSEEEMASNTSKGKVPARTTKTASGNRSKAKTVRLRKKTKTDKSLNANEIEDLTTSIFSSEEAEKVEQQLRSTLVNDPRLNKGDCLVIGPKLRPCG